MSLFDLAYKPIFASLWANFTRSMGLLNFWAYGLLKFLSLSWKAHKSKNLSLCAFQKFNKPISAGQISLNKHL